MLAIGKPTVASQRRALSEDFRCAGIESAQADARLLVAHALGIDGAHMLANGERALEPAESAAIEALARRRLAREPVARILGVKEFWSLPLRVTPAVLVPRPETETVIESALEALGAQARLEPLRILDIGIGSGALLLAMLKELPNARGVGSDISSAALEVARDNAARLGLGARCAFVACDAGGALGGAFDLVLSNPPYIASGEIPALPPEVRDFDPNLALDGGADGLDGYRAIAADARRLLAAGGRLIVELGAGQEAAVAALFTKVGSRVAPARKDLAGIARALTATMAP